LAVGSYGDIELDGAGDLYFAIGSSGGVLRWTPGGTVSTWSAAMVLDLSLAPTGDGYGAGRSLCNCILAIRSDGSSSTLRKDSFGWGYVALTPDASLYASAYGGGEGLYIIDRSTGQPSVIVAGGPGPNGNGIYKGMASGPDGMLYVLGSLDGSLAGSRLFRLDESTLTPVATPPHGGSTLVLGPNGHFYVVTAFDYGSGYPVGELWIVDPVSGAGSLLASSSNGRPGDPYPIFGAVAYNASAQMLYLSESNNIWAIKVDSSVPSLTKSWGAVKALYRR
jgi:hypothetical protein